MDFTRDELRRFHTRSIAKGTTIFLIDFAGFLAATIGVASASSWPVRLASSLAAGWFASVLFVIGHDACHHALTPSRWWNRVLGTLSFLATLHPFSLWDLGHNRTHHRFTNQRGLDYVWEPLERDEYLALSRFARWHYRFRRTFVGHTTYYMTHVWWTKMCFPRSSAIRGYRRSYVVDQGLVVVWVIIWIGGLLALRAYRSDQALATSDAINVVLLGVVAPFIVFNVLMSVMVYLHHTHPSVRWVRPATGDVRPSSLDLQLQATVHIVFPGPVNWLFHRIMEHTAHHARPGIPLYELLEAQTLIDARQRTIVQPWSLAFHLDTLRRCKLFDTTRECWMDYTGTPTS